MHCSDQTFVLFCICRLLPFLNVEPPECVFIFLIRDLFLYVPRPPSWCVVCYVNVVRKSLFVCDVGLMNAFLSSLDRTRRNVIRRLRVTVDCTMISGMMIMAQWLTPLIRIAVLYNRIAFLTHLFSVKVPGHSSNKLTIWRLCHGL